MKLSFECVKPSGDPGLGGVGMRARLRLRDAEDRVTARPELARDPFEEVGDRAVEVEDDGPVLSTAVSEFRFALSSCFPEAKLL